MSAETVLVTGGSGFIGSHTILQLLSQGYRVRTTVRSLRREPEVRALLASGGAKPGADLTFFAADLTSDAGWAEAVTGCHFVLHIASPLPVSQPKNENDLIIPARDGVLRVLRAAHAADVRRVVLTSSFAAIAYSQKLVDSQFTEINWTDPAWPGISAYVKSKTLAEKAAWEYISTQGHGLELSVVNPVYVAGPVLGADYSASIEVVRRLMDGALPGCPRLSFNIVDVRDVADLHLRAMRSPAAANERFLAVSGASMTMQEIAKTLKSGMGAAARRVPTGELPDWLVQLSALFDPTLRQFISELGKVKNASNEKAKRLLGWAPRSREAAILASAESLVRLKLLKNS